MRSRFSHPALQLLTSDRWTDAFGWLLTISHGLLGEQVAQGLLDAVNDRPEVQSKIHGAIALLYHHSTQSAGQLALAWSMLTCDPRRPASFWPVLPQLQYVLDTAELDEDDDEVVRRRLRVWWRGADADFRSSKVNIFRLADPEAECWPDVEVAVDPSKHHVSTAASLSADVGLPTLVVMPKEKSTALTNYHTAYKSMLGAALPLIVVRDVQAIRRALHVEFPHATAAVDELMRDLRDNKPFWTKPVCLVGAPGSGKSRLVGRLAEAVSERLYVHRYDGAVADGQFSGTSKGWSNTIPSVPVRAVQASMTGNPVVLIDELDKAKESQNGFLAHALLSVTDRLTAKKYRDQSLDAELDLSMLSYIATANDAALLPSMLRDRFRLIRMPTPTLEHLPALAANVLAEIAREDESRAGEPPLAADELANIGKVWRQHKCSMRALKSLVEGTLEVRDQCAMRH
ncbi:MULTISPECIES: AAA family ATPase [unclassified Bradyrhizobium]|uniref:AAA family ATPase n=1 Tax=unclassified Bradyrhizobium TaxID=2631580 RepID=UPI001FF75A42|nr:MULTISPECIES: AAA family ATPase [unclassified Bradyrhizobium]MCK1540332.1 AAA family ATPase [Bradyrhizobium sp. 176]MCK1556174.1 AAA family ATPase [Bradyrhizobium sp. 171]